MAILVSDSSVLIDLERGGLLETTFLCGLTLVVPDLLYENELKDWNGPYLVQLGLSITVLTSDEVQLAQEVLNLRSALSPVDCFALACATRPNHTLLAGDGALRAEALARKLTCSGLLWLLDQMLASAKVSTQVLCEGLTKICQDRRCRLPKSEVERRLKDWCK
jgi:hypothetical protein